MRLHKLLTGLVLGTGLALAVGVSAQTTGEPSGGQQQGMMENQTANKEISGTVSSIGTDKFVLKAPDGSKLTLNTSPNTKIYDQAGNTASLSSLQEGQQVRAAYDVQGNENHATRIDITSNSKSGEQK